MIAALIATVSLVDPSPRAPYSFTLKWLASLSCWAEAISETCFEPDAKLTRLPVLLDRNAPRVSLWEL